MLIVNPEAAHVSIGGEVIEMACLQLRDLDPRSDFLGFDILPVTTASRVTQRSPSLLPVSFRKHGKLAENALSIMIVLALISALTTEKLGIHSLFGAFFMGAIMPKAPGFIHAVQNKLESLTVVALLPLFFAFSGLRTSVRIVQGELWIYMALGIATAIAGKFGGSMFASRVAGVSWRQSAALGILMNTRGLMELIALNICLDIGVISPTVFTITVLMALVTTLMTSPLLELVYPVR